jgi:hypothetical protein
MLLRFRFSNFRSFRREEELSLVAGPFTDMPDVVRKPAGFGEGILPGAAIYGANASGKTNVIKAAAFMSYAVSVSHRSWKPEGPIPREPFMGDEESAREPSEFEADFLLSGVRYRYGFRINSEAVLEEWLCVYPNDHKQTWFHRKQGSPIVFSKKMPGENRTIETLTRKNSLFLSAAAQNNHDTLLPVHRWLAGIAVEERERTMGITAMLCAQSPGVKDEIAGLLAGADLGVAGMTVEQPRLDFLPKIRLLHRVGDRTVSFDKEQESAGTVAYLALLGPVAFALDKGIPLLIDELDESLHPLLATELIRLFNNPLSNPNGAQLIFNTQDTNLLSSGVLRRDQIWFTEKGNDGSSHLFPLSDFKPRRQENLQNGYLQGRYGAIPFINPDPFLTRFEGGNV